MSGQSYCIIYKTAAVNAKTESITAPYGLPIFAPAPVDSSTAVSNGVTGLAARVEVFDAEDGMFAPMQMCQGKWQ